MENKIIDGKEVAKKYRKQIKQEVLDLNKQGIHPALAVVIVGDDPASRVYVDNKKKDCEKCGIISEEIALPAETGEAELLSLIDSLNKREELHGILVQMPLPKGISEQNILRAISPEKDVDAFHPYNVGLIVEGSYNFVPCTPAGVLALLDEYGVEIEGKECVVVGRSNIVGKPQALLLLHKNGTVTVCHSRTKNLKEVCLRADILVSAVGKTGIITADMVKEGAVVIDVAMNKKEDGKLTGDVCFDEVYEKASLITPVPGGVGPMTRVMLLKNTLKAAKLKHNID
jgi:methylenetetrahydrofolate dehydrogenase (NADP+)/methenyltetrahydrofolate cyclohydrolase